jgi:PQQ-dependent dehydrogenase (methanol/ethanol family)
VTRHIILLFSVMAILGVESIGPAHAQATLEGEVTEGMLQDPDSSDWLMFSRTYDNQRFSPLQQINRENVDQLKMAWTRGIGPGVQETIPLVHNGTMYVGNPGGLIQALDATNGDLIWEYKREMPEDIGEYISPGQLGRIRTLGIYKDMVYFATPDGFVAALGTETGELHWETQAHDYKTGALHSTGPIVAGGKVLTGRNCTVGPDLRETCFIVAHDAQTGKEAWRFNTAAGDNEPGGDTWGGQPEGSRGCSPWGLPGAYDAKRNLVYWGVANPDPHTRYKRHDGEPFAVPLTTPAELYCNSTLALDVATGKLVWYYQHLPGDDWDSDWTQERVLLTSKFNPDPNAVKWFNPNIKRGETRDMVASVGEGGGLWVLDQATGEFLWGIPFPADTPLFHISDVDGITGKTSINPATVLTRDKEEHTLCFADTKGYYPMAYHPGENALYIPYHDACLKRTGAFATENGHTFKSFIRTGPDADDWTGVAKVNMETGQIERFHTQRYPTNSAVLATAGDLIFWGDMNRRFRAFDAKSGEILWESVVGGIVQNSTITYSVDGKQYVAILTGDGAGHTGKLALTPELKTARGHNAVYVFALP